MSRVYRVHHRQSRIYYDDGIDSGEINVDRDHVSIKIIVQMMTGDEYIFGTQHNKGETYGDVKSLLLENIKISPKPLRRQVVFIDPITFDYTKFDDTKFDPDSGIQDGRELLPSQTDPIIIKCFIIDPEWSDDEKDFITYALNQDNTIFKDQISRGRNFNDAFLWVLRKENDEGEKRKKLITHGFDTAYLFNAIRDSPNIEELECINPAGRVLDMSPRELYIPSVKKLALKGDKITPLIIMDIVGANPYIEELVLICNSNHFCFTDERMAKFFEIIKKNNISLSKLFITDAHPDYPDYYPKNTYKMKDLVDLLKKRSSLLHVEFTDSKVIIEDLEDVELLSEELKHNQFLKKLVLCRHQIISSVIPEKNIIDSLKGIDGHVQEYHDDLLCWKNPIFDQ